MGSEVVVTINDFASDGAIEGLRGAIVVTAERVRSIAAPNAPRKTGLLRNSIMWRKGWGNDALGLPPEGGFNEAEPGGEKATEKIEKPSGEVAVVGTAVEYATKQEFGTKNIIASPYLRSAGAEVRGMGATDLIRKYGLDAMKAEFDKRKEKRTVSK